jgi:hypothetical protein
MDINLNVGQAFPEAPLGVLGQFIEDRLRHYVEPERAGTPKGEPIGFSRKKFHAALLALTNVDLRKQAKHIKVSYGLLRKWRTEDAFFEQVMKLEDDFVKDVYFPASELSLMIMVGKAAEILKIKTMPGTESAVGDEKGLPGFEDISLYAPMLTLRLHHEFNAAVKETAQGGKPPDKALKLVRPLTRWYRGMTSNEGRERLRRDLVIRLCSLLNWVSIDCRKKKDLDTAAWTMSVVASLSTEALSD